MALTTAQETYLKGSVQIASLQKQIKQINAIAISAMNVKRDEIKAIDAKRNEDIALVESQIKAIEDTL